jgi:phosphoribosylglycinamide formyltransferase 1
MKLLVFASGRGSNFEAMIKASKSGYLHSKIAGLLCDKECPAVDIAKANSIPFSILQPKDYVDKQAYIRTLLDTVHKYEPDYIILAGYMRILPSELIDRYPLKIVNVHPSLLPAFPGKDSILQAWEAKVKTTGVTVHFVNDKLDSGPVLRQESIAVPDTLEKLEAGIHKIEHKLYPAVVKELTEDPFDTILVSRCLLGANCRYDGGNKYSKRVETFVKGFKGKLMDKCPELEAGFGIPRPTTDIVNGRAIMQGTGDITEKLKSACLKIVASIEGSKKILAILKERSPSCGVKDPKGIFTSCMKENLGKKIYIVSEEDL